METTDYRESKVHKSFYTNYYQGALHNTKGFKLVLGGTGLGKTSGIIETIRQNTDEKKRFFYIANRLQLLNEMVAELKEKNIGYCLQERNVEVISKIKEEDYERLLRTQHIQHYANKLYKGGVNAIIQHYDFVKVFAKGESTHFPTIDVSNAINESVRSIFSFFRKIIRSAADEQNQKAYNELIQNPTIKVLFPYIDFINNPQEKRVFLVSLQKAFYGFFDGKRVINLYKLQNNEERGEQNVLFLDEFDFLENDLLTQICKDVVVEQPFDFVERFYNVLTKYKLSRDHFLANHREIRTDLEKVTQDVETLTKKYELPYPKINHFLCNEKKLIGTSIFQTRYSLSNHAIYLNYHKENDDKDKINAFYLEIANEQNKPNAYVLLNVVNQATAAILRIFKRLETERPKIYQDLVNHCFKASDTFKRILRQVHQYPHKRIAVGTNESKMYYNGYGLYEVHNLGYDTDSEEVEFKYYSLFSTPESILLSLAKNNLVFGLSATAEFNRYLKNFDTAWLRNELSNLYHDISEEDILCIQKANSNKSEIRKNATYVEMAEENTSEEVSIFIDKFVQTRQQDFGDGNKRAFRKKRLTLFFATLEWIATRQARDNTNLLFLSSYKQILQLFEDWPLPEEGLYKIETMDNALEHCYKIHFAERDIIVLFFDANQGKEIAKHEKNKQDYYRLFWQDLPVLLVTTYPSAGNGVNLFFYKDQEKTQKADFSNIHLLDSPYYFFNPIDNEKDTEQTKSEKIKANIYYLAKLEKNKMISERQFKAYLNNIRKIDSFNSLYLATPDGILNCVSTYIQALGRVERVWDQMSTQAIRLEKQVYNHLEDFATKEEYQSDFNRNKPYFSQNIQVLFTHILESQFGRGHQQRQIQQEGLKTTDEKCKAAIKQLLVKLAAVRENKLSQEKASQIREEWQSLREYALKQAFAKKDYDRKKETEEYKLFKKYACTFETDAYDHRDKCLWIQKETLNIIQKGIRPDSSFDRWYLDGVFQNIQRNAILRGHFDLNRYEQGFSGKGIYFTPYFYQCILAGAIGEEAVKAVFKHEKIALSEKEIVNELFELIDLKVQGKNWYIDAKNYSEQTVVHFQLSKDDYFYHPQLNENSFKVKAQEKLNSIRSFHSQEDCKIIYINAFGDGERPVQYFDENFDEVNNSFKKASIIVVQSMLKTDEAANSEKNYAPNFQYFISELKRHLNYD